MQLLDAPVLVEGGRGPTRLISPRSTFDHYEGLAVATRSRLAIGHRPAGVDLDRQRRHQEQRMLLTLTGLALAKRFPPALALVVPYGRDVRRRMAAEGALPAQAAFYPAHDAVETATRPSQIAGSAPRSPGHAGRPSPSAARPKAHPSGASTRRDAPAARSRSRSSSTRVGSAYAARRRGLRGRVESSSAESEGGCGDGACLAVG